VKDLPDMERLKSAKFTGLRWDIDPIVVEYFRYLLNDVVGTTGRKTSSSQQPRTSNGVTSSSRPSSINNKAVKSTSAMLMSDRRLSQSTSVTSAGHTEARRCSMFRQFSTQQQQQPTYNPSPPEASNKALARWKKV